MTYVAKEQIYLNDQNKPCAEDDPQVATMLVRAGGQLANDDVQRFGLAQDKRLVRIPDASDQPVAERGQTYYEATGQEPPTPKNAQAILGEPAAAAQPAAQPAKAEAPASQAKAEAAPAKAKG